MAFHHSPKTVTDGLVLYLDAGNFESYPGSGTVWKDLADGNNGTLVNGPTFDSGSGGSIIFDGVDDYVNITPGKLLPRSEFTAEWFLKINGTNTNFILWISEFQVEISPTTIIRRWYNNNTSQNRNTENFGNNYENQWVHIVWQVGSLIDICYLNGTQIGTNRNTTISNPNITGYNGNSNVTWIGRDEVTADMNDNLSIFKFYNRILTPSEITQNYNALKSRFGLK